MAVTVLVVADRGRFSWALINRTAVKKEKGGGGGGSTFLARSIRNAGGAVHFHALSGSIQRAGLSGKVDARDTSSQLRACV